jgi:hypothetical protein
MSTIPSLGRPCRVCGADAWHVCYDCRAPLCVRHQQPVLLQAVLLGRLEQVHTQLCHECLLRRLRTPSTWRTMILHR